MKKILLPAVGLLLLLPAVPRVSSAVRTTPTAQEQTKEKTRVFSGTVIKDRDNFILSDAANKLSYILDNATEASKYEGKKVKVTGIVDAANNTIHVETIQEIA